MMGRVLPYFVYTVDLIAHCLVSDGAGQWNSYQIADFGAYRPGRLLIRGSDYDDGTGAMVVALGAYAAAGYDVSWKHTSYNGGASWGATLIQERHATTSMRYRMGAFHFLDMRPGASEFTWIYDLWRGTGGANWGFVEQVWEGDLEGPQCPIYITYGGETWDYGPVYPSPTEHQGGRDFRGNVASSDGTLIFYVNDEVVHTLSVGTFGSYRFWCGGMLGAARRYAYFF